MCIVLTLFYFALTALWQPDVLCPNLARYASYADSVCPAVVLNPEKGKKYGNVYEYHDCLSTDVRNMPLSTRAHTPQNAQSG